MCPLSQAYLGVGGLEVSSTAFWMATTQLSYPHSLEASTVQRMLILPQREARSPKRVLSMSGQSKRSNSCSQSLWEAPVSR